MLRIPYFKTFIRFSSEESTVGRKGNYQFILVGIVGLVALVAVLILIQGFPSADRNLAGQTSYYRAPTFSIEEDETDTLNVQGVDYEVTAFAVFPPDHTGQPSAILVVNGEVTTRLYPGVLRKLGGVTVQIDTIEGKTVNYYLVRSLGQPQPFPGDLFDYLTAGETKTYTIGAYDYAVELNTVDDGRKAHLRINDAEFALSPGQTGYMPGATITMFDTAQGSQHRSVASFYITQEEEVCGATDGQTLSCRGSRACCGGICKPLPTCAGKPDGPVESCGARPMYCCYGQLSLHRCVADDSDRGTIVEASD